MKKARFASGGLTRKIKNFSQGCVADKLSVSQSTYSDIENGKQIINKEK